MLPGMMKAACDILEKRIHGDYSDFPARVRLKATIVNRDSIKDMSVGALTAVNQMKIRVPDDLSLAAFDDMELCSIVRPGLTAVRQPLKEMMKAACDILEKRVHGDYSDFPARVSLKATIVNRDSIKDRYGRK